jgi:hypothetical protein
LTRLLDYPRELADIINFQDEDGETALTMSARYRSKCLVKLRIDHGADPKIANRDGFTTSSRTNASAPRRGCIACACNVISQCASSLPPVQASGPYAFVPANSDCMLLHHSMATRKARHSHAQSRIWQALALACSTVWQRHLTKSCVTRIGTSVRLMNEVD